MYLIPIPAFAENNLWWLQDGQRAVVVDPVGAGNAGPVFEKTARLGLQLKPILVTHHHADCTSAKAQRLLLPRVARGGQINAAVHKNNSVFATVFPVIRP